MLPHYLAKSKCAAVPLYSHIIARIISVLGGCLFNKKGTQSTQYVSGRTDNAEAAANHYADITAYVQCFFATSCHALQKGNRAVTPGDTSLASSRWISGRLTVLILTQLITRLDCILTQSVYQAKIRDLEGDALEH